MKRRMMTSKRAGVLAGFLVAGLGVSPAWATGHRGEEPVPETVDFFWQGDTGGSFTDTTLWDPPDGPGGAGGAGDTVNFDLGVLPIARYTVSGVAGESDRLLVRNDALTLSLSLSDDYTLLSTSITEPGLVVGAASGDTGDLILTGGGLFQTQRGSIGQVADSSGIVTIDNLQWVNDGTLLIGDAGAGTLIVEAGGRVASTDAWIGQWLNSTGTVAVTGAGSAWTSSGELNIGGDTLADAEFEDNAAGDGTLHVSDGGLVTANTVRVGTTGKIEGDGTITANIVNEGLVTPGNSPGALSIDGFMPTTGDAFDLLDFNTLSGTFAQINLPTLTQGSWDTSDLQATGTIRVVPDRVCLTGILFMLKAGIPWEDFPQEMGCCGMTLWNRLREWQVAGVWQEIHEVLLAELREADRIDFSRAVVDSASVRAVHGGKKRDRARWTGEKLAASTI